jgi:hypothetical protein
MQMLTTTLISNPKISGEIRESAFYQPLSLGQTRSILLIGHADSKEFHVPYRVTSLKTAINWMQANPRSPLLRSMLEAYNAGCRDIWLYSIGPMSEYREDIALRNTVEVELGNKTFYENYHEKLQTAYTLLKDYDIFQVIVPVEASFCETSDIDFATPLAQLCEDIFESSSYCTMGVLGSRSSQYNQDLFDEVVNDSMLTTIGDKGKYIILVMGEGIILNQQMSVTYSAPVTVQVASLLATVHLGRSIFGIRFNGVASMSGFNLREEQIKQLTEAKINPGLRTQRGKRGQTFESWLVTDNSLAPTGSDYWSINQTRVICDISNTLKEYGEAYIGSIATESFKQLVYDYLNYLVNLEQIKGFSVDITFEPRKGTAKIILAITPIFGIRNIYFTVESGPGS